MSVISTVAALKEALSTCSGKEFASLVKKLKLSTEDLKQYMSWSDDHYTRNCIARNERYELLLLCWNGNQSTPIHCHGGEECWVMMIEGDLQEDRYDLHEDDTISLSNIMKIQDHQISYMNDNMGLHKLSNNSDVRAVSLHLYMNPIDKCTVYDEVTHTRTDKVLVYHTDARHIIAPIG